VKINNLLATKKPEAFFEIFDFIAQPGDFKMELHEEITISTAKAETVVKLAQLGGRLIMSTAKELSKMFFEKFEKIMNGEEELLETKS
jgi:hypothetical protein